jgi:hypothetical protein
MSLEDWLKEGRLKGHKTSAREVAELLKLVDRDLADSAIKEISVDRRFATAYNAVLQLATIALHAAGYRGAFGYPPLIDFPLAAIGIQTGLVGRRRTGGSIAQH